jgi:hypothetical protein
MSIHELYYVNPKGVIDYFDTPDDPYSQARGQSEKDASKVKSYLIPRWV